MVGGNAYEIVGVFMFYLHAKFRWHMTAVISKAMCRYPAPPCFWLRSTYIKKYLNNN